MPFFVVRSSDGKPDPLSHVFTFFCRIHKNLEVSIPKRSILKSSSLPLVGAFGVLSVVATNRGCVPHTSFPWGLGLSLAFVLAFRTRSLGVPCLRLGLPFSSSFSPVP